MDESIKVKGHLAWVFTKADGTLIKGERDNVVTTVGKQLIASLLGSASPPANIGWMGFGSGTTAPAATDTQLQTELTVTGYSRPTVTKSVSGQTITYTTTLTGLTGASSGSPVSVNEAGLFNASSAGTMLAHQLTGTVQFTSGTDSLQITWQVTFN